MKNYVWPRAEKEESDECKQVQRQIKKFHNELHAKLKNANFNIIQAVLFISEFHKWVNAHQILFVIIIHTGSKHLRGYFSQPETLPANKKMCQTLGALTRTEKLWF